jgi:glycosidase
VDSGFWREFFPAITCHAASLGIPNFQVFGEVAVPDAGTIARHTHADLLPSALDFAFQQVATQYTAGLYGSTVMEEMYFFDPIYNGGVTTAGKLQTFLGNHDQGRFAFHLQSAMPNITIQQLEKLVPLGYALMLFSRGSPVIYYGDEQGYIGEGGMFDAARQPMFATNVSSYMDQNVLGSTSVGPQYYNQSSNFYQQFSALTAIRNSHPVLRHGSQEIRVSSSTPGVFAFTRTDPSLGQYLVAFNMNSTSSRIRSTVDAEYSLWSSIDGQIPCKIISPGVIEVDLPSYSYAICISS